jgi:hypothetical protein
LSRTGRFETQGEEEVKYNPRYNLQAGRQGTKQGTLNNSNNLSQLLLAEKEILWRKKMMRFFHHNRMVGGKQGQLKGLEKASRFIFLSKNKADKTRMFQILTFQRSNL